MSAGLANANMDSQNWMQYTSSHVAIMALLLSQNGLRAISEHLISKHFLGKHAPPSPSHPSAADGGLILAEMHPAK